MFQLEKEISLWSESLVKKGKISAANIEELKDHLYSEINAQLKQGYDDKQAFNNALQKMGTVQSLSSEYAKNNFWVSSLTAIASAPYLMKIFAIILIYGGCLHSFYGVRFLSDAFGFLNVYALVLFILLLMIFVWSVYKGVMILAGKEGGYIGLLLFFLIQIPMLHYIDGNFEMTNGLAIYVYFGDTESHFLFDVGGELHINTDYAADREFFGINLFAVMASLLMIIKMWHRSKNIMMELPFK